MRRVRDILSRIRARQRLVGRRAYVLGLVAVSVAFIATGKASRDIGLATWWLGPAGDPQPVWIMLLPFVAPCAMVVGVLYGIRNLPWLGLGAAAVTAAVGLGDIGRVNGIAVVELSLAAAGALVSIAALAGRFRS